jgi:hypothetical protein
MIFENNFFSEFNDVIHNSLHNNPKKIFLNLIQNSYFY